MSLKTISLGLLLLMALTSAKTRWADTWYICSNCCKTVKASSAPHTNGCRKSSSGYHNYGFCGVAGDFNYTCRYCDASVELTGSQGPAASTCCASGGTHDWYHKK